MSETSRPLYDTIEGGPPRAFECRLKENGRVCGRILPTLKGLWSHQVQKHKFKAQGELFFPVPDRDNQRSLF